MSVHSKMARSKNEYFHSDYNEHIGFTEDRQFICYSQPPSFVCQDSVDAETNEEKPDKTRISEWFERMEFLEEDLHWLLHLPAHRFWSQVIYDASLQKCLESYLCYAPRYYDIFDISITDDTWSTLQRIHRLVFMVFLRLSTYKESQSSHLTPLVFADIIYDNFLFDIPKIMDLCVLYGRTNRALLQKMIQNIFECQPKYTDDLYAAIPTVLEVFNTIKNQFGLESSSETKNSDEPRKLGESLSPLSKLSWSMLKDLIFYLVDTSATLSAFLDIYPMAAFAFHQEDTTLRISNFYEAVFPPLHTELEHRSKTEPQSIMTEICKRIALAKTCLVQSFRSILFCCCVQPILDRDATSNVEEFLQVMSTSISDKWFTCDYQQLYPIEDDLEIISQASVVVDPTSIEYILSGIYSAYEALGKPYEYKTVPSFPNVQSNLHKGESPIVNHDLPENEISQVTENATNRQESNYNISDGACASPKLGDGELHSLVSQVIGVLSDLGEGFVECCLEYYNYDAGKVITAILDDNLPDSLKKLDTKMKRKSSVLAERKNIYDNDEFDVFTKDTIDRTRIHKGKRTTVLDDISDILKDEHSKSLREVYQKYSVVEETDSVLYEDEYDDAYDDRDVGPEEPPLADDILLKRPVTTPRVLEKNELSDEEESPESTSENQNSEMRNGFSRNRDEFIANPAELRRKAEERAQEQRSRRYNVRGKPRGQGQDESTLRNRDFKEKHKSMVANHNRRFQSDRKRSKGMFPT